MRATIFIILAFIITSVNAASIQIEVISYECKHADATKDGFTCKLEPNEFGAIMQIHLSSNYHDVDEETHEYFNYQYNKMLMRFFDLGGKRFEVTYDKWGNDKYKSCSLIKGRKYSHDCNVITK